MEKRMNSKNNHLIILWTSGDREVALNMVFMYTLNALKHNWWNEITFIIWGPSAKLTSQDSEIKSQIIKMKEIGINLEACKACADKYGVSEDLHSIGVDVKYMGIPLTNYLKSENHVITF